jgi:hypothetical protein
MTPCSHGMTAMGMFILWSKPRLCIYHINAILKSCSWGTTFGHSFRIGRASFYLSEKIDPEIICIAGHWCSLKYEVYICAFEQVALHHFGGLLTRSWATFSLGWVCIANLLQIVCHLVGKQLSLFHVQIELSSLPTQPIGSQRQMRQDPWLSLQNPVVPRVMYVQTDFGWFGVNLSGFWSGFQNFRWFVQTHEIALPGLKSHPN